MYNACCSFHVIYILHCYIRVVEVPPYEHAPDKKSQRKNSRLKRLLFPFLGPCTITKPKIPRNIFLMVHGTITVPLHFCHFFVCVLVFF